MPNKFYSVKQGLCLLITLLGSFLLMAQQNDTVVVNNDTVATTVSSYSNTLQHFLSGNRFVNTSDEGVVLPNQVKHHHKQEFIFYVLLLLGATLSFLRFFYLRYFNNLFKVFFNTSLRQSQLTDQLLQAKLPSLLFNVFFTVTGGLFVYMYIKQKSAAAGINSLQLAAYCIIIFASVYLIKNLTLKFTGWITGLSDIVDTYIFIIFLINKIIGVLLLPVIVVMAFSAAAIAKTAMVISLIMIGAMLLLRFYRSYSLLQHRLKMSPFHFFMYLVGVEVLPLLLIYKGMVIFLTKNV